MIQQGMLQQTGQLIAKAVQSERGLVDKLFSVTLETEPQVGSHKDQGFSKDACIAGCSPRCSCWISARECAHALFTFVARLSLVGACRDGGRSSKLLSKSRATGKVRLQSLQ